MHGAVHFFLFFLMKMASSILRSASPLHAEDIANWDLSFPPVFFSDFPRADLL